MNEIMWYIRKSRIRPFVSFVMRLWLLLTGRATIVANARPERMARCFACCNWSPMFCDPCDVCGCTGEAEYKWCGEMAKGREAA